MGLQYRSGMRSRVHWAHRALRGHQRGQVDRSQEREAQVLSAAAGQTALAPEVAARLMGRIRNPEPVLSAREIQLLELLATGLGNRAIAKQLFISEATVKTHLVHIYGKLGVDNRTAAISVATQRRIIRRFALMASPVTRPRFPESRMPRAPAGALRSNRAGRRPGDM